MRIGNGIGMKERDHAFLSFCQSLENEILHADDTNQEQFVIVMQEEIGSSSNSSDDGKKKGKKNRKARQQKRTARYVSNCDISLEEIANRIQVDHFGR